MDGRKSARALNEQAQANQRAEKPRQTLKEAKEGLYDKIAARVSVKAMDRIIWGLVALIVLAVIIGMALGR